MNYIPGFSNYLEASVPEYGPAPIMDAEPVVPQRAMVEPTTQEAAAPYNLSGLDSLYGLNFGTNFGGGAMGDQYQTDPNLQYIGAPLSNKGNATSQTGGNTFAVRADQPVRLVDHRTNQVVFEGSGFDAARKATELGQSLTDQFGRKANYSIQTADPAGNYSTVAYEKKNKSTLGEIANVVGTVAPLALGFVPGFGQLSLLAKMGAAAGAGGLGAALKGDDILKGALLGGATAGIVSGTGLDKAIGGALGSLGKGATQGAVTAGSKAAADATGDIVATGLSKVLQGTGSAAANALVSNAGKAGLNSVSGSNPPPQNLAQQPSQIADPLAVVPEVPYDGIKVIGPKLASGSGLPFAASFPVPVGAMLAGTLNTAQQTPAEKTAEDIEAEKNPMVVTGPKNLLPADFATSAAAAAAANAANGMADAPDRAEMTDEELDAYMNDVSKGGGLGSLLSDMTLAQKVNLLGLGVGAAGSLAGGKGGSGQAGAYIPGGAGSGRLNPIFSAQLPAAGALGTVGATRTARPLGDQDWLTYGTRPELKFFDYSTTPANPAPVTSPVPGNPAGPIMAEDKIRHSEEGIPLWMQLGLPNPNAPVTQPGAAGQIMQERDPTAMFEGGALDAASDKPSKRNEFAVNGPGTGRSDDIPAVLSDGEYVIDAETVALLGDGSSKAGAKKLDELRVKVRKHKGKKLAKGRFSANAKKPEAYLSGGRI
jgi:hypothetical protein